MEKSKKFLRGDSLTESTNLEFGKTLAKTIAASTAVATIIAAGGIIVSAILCPAPTEKNGYENDILREIAELRSEMYALEDKYDAILSELRTKVALTGTIELDDTDYISEPLEVNTYWWKERIPENIDTNRYDCEPDIFGHGSDQRKLQNECYTDYYTGIKVYEADGERYFCAAMASAYGIEVGEAWQVTLDCGSIFNVILSDFQQPIIDPDPNYFGEIWLRDSSGNIIDVLRNYDEEPVCHVLEFVVDLDALHPDAKQAGTMSALDYFGGLYGNGGNIVNMKYLGKVWNV